MPVRLTFEGLADLKEALKQLPEELAAEAAREVDAAAQAAKTDIIAAYPEGETANLRRGVQVKALASSRFGVTRQVRSTARHAHLYEYGTTTRQTALGYNRGFMPGVPTVIPIMMRRRGALMQTLVEIVRRAGFQIRGAVD